MVEGKKLSITSFVTRQLVKIYFPCTQSIGMRVFHIPDTEVDVRHVVVKFSLFHLTPWKLFLLLVFPMKLFNGIV